ENAGLGALVTLESRQWEGYREHNEQQRAGLYTNAGLQFDDRWTTRFYVTALDSDQELPGALTRVQLDLDPEQANAAALEGHDQRNVAMWRIANCRSFRIDANRRHDFGVALEEQRLHHPIVWVAVDSD